MDLKENSERFPIHMYMSSQIASNTRAEIGDAFHSKTPNPRSPQEKDFKSSNDRAPIGDALHSKTPNPRSPQEKDFICRHCGKSQRQPEILRDPSGYAHLSNPKKSKTSLWLRTLVDESSPLVHRNDESSTIIKWFDAPNRFSPESFQRENGTNRWFLEGSVFDTWKKNPASSLHVHGPVGCGKTVLSYAVVVDLNSEFRDHGTSVLYFCFSALDEQRQTLKSLLKSLIIQLCPPDFLPYELRQLFKKHHERYPTTQCSNDELEALFHSLTKSIMSDLFIVIDGIDEVSFGPCRGDLLQFLKALIAWQLPRLHLLLTSRPHDDILSWSDRIAGLKTMEVPKVDIARDLQIFVQNSIERDPSLKLLLPSTKSSIMKTLCGDSNYMFQWASLQLDRMKFLRIVNDNTIKALLTQIPRDLNNTYARIISEVQPEFTKEAIAALTWLSFASRSLFIEELQEVCAYPTGEFTGSNHWPVRDVMALLPSVIRIDPWPDFQNWEKLPARTYVVLLAHFSIREYLTSVEIHSGSLQVFALNSKLAHRTIATNCLIYILTSNTPMNFPRNRGLLEYAWNYWAIHSVKQYTTYDGNNKENGAIQMFAKVSYRGILDWIPLPVSGGLSGFELSEMKDRLMVPYFLPECQDYDYEKGPFSALDGWSMLRFFKTRGDGVRDPINLLKMRASPHRFTEIQCTPLVRSLYNPEPFIAISWAWSSPSKAAAFDNIIRIGGVPLMYPHSLVQNLRNIRQLEGESPRPIWIDALSIDQSDLEVRGVTLGLLAKIFGKAETVIVMLGDAEPGDEVLVKILYELHRLIIIPWDEAQNITGLKELWEAYHQDHHKALTKIFSRPWWKRMWVLQEYLLPSRITFMLGSLSFTSEVVETLVNHQSGLEALLSEVERDLHHSRKFGETCNSSGGSLSNAWIYTSAWRSICEVTLIRLAVQNGKQFGLARLLYLARERECEDERDRVFSLRGMASDADQMPSDYRLSQVSLRTAVTKAFIRTHKSLDHLSWIQIFEHGQPSWVLPDFVFKAETRTPLVQGYFVHERPGIDRFDAAKGIETETMINFPNSDHLIVYGMLVSKIRSMLDVQDMPSEFKNELGLEKGAFELYSRDRQLARLNSGHIGLVPSDSRIRDEVMILMGGKVPYVLRPLLMSPNTHRFVGDCFIAGIMLGEFTRQSIDQGKTFVRYILA